MKSLVHAQYVTCDESPLYVDYFLYCAYVRLFYLVPFLIFNQFLDQIPQNWRIFRFGFGFSVWSAHNFGRIFYGLVEKLIENAVNI
jgi:hypothetical protein